MTIRKPTMSVATGTATGFVGRRIIALACRTIGRGASG
jgi:hypothetical protein